MHIYGLRCFVPPPRLQPPTPRPVFAYVHRKHLHRRRWHGGISFCNSAILKSTNEFRPDDYCGRRRKRGERTDGRTKGRTCLYVLLYFHFVVARNYLIIAGRLFLVDNSSANIAVVQLAEVIRKEGRKEGNRPPHLTQKRWTWGGRKT